MVNQDVKVAVTMDDGSVVVVAFFVTGASPTLPEGAAWVNDRSGRWMREPSEANINAELKKAFPPVNQLGMKKPQPVTWTVVAEQDVPKDRTYRNAWRHDGKAFSHDLEHARQLHLDRVRSRRLARLGELDRDWMKATGQGDKAAAAKIEAERQALRDAPETLPVDKAKTVDELKAMWPKDLPR